MILGIGCDIVRVARFRRWVANDALIARFFNARETLEGASFDRLCEFYAARFCAKEAFSKALGTGLSGFSLRDVFVVRGEGGRPVLCVEGEARRALEARFGEGCSSHVSLSHEKEYAMSVVIIER